MVCVYGAPFRQKREYDEIMFQGVWTMAEYTRWERDLSETKDRAQIQRGRYQRNSNVKSLPSRK